MKNIKNFKRFDESLDSVNYPSIQIFESHDFKKFCDSITSWEDLNQKSVHWDLYIRGGGNLKSSWRKLSNVEHYWSEFVKDGHQMYVLNDTDSGRLISGIVRYIDDDTQLESNFILAYSEDNKRVSKEEFINIYNKLK